MNNYDTEFLKKLDNQQNREIYARATSLTWEEKPIEAITGKIQNASINIDGASAVRRSCSITMIAKDVNISDFYWGVKTKFILEVGIKNTIDPKYPDIIWFNQGMYVITSFNSQLTSNSFTISISGKDKMCLLNGELSGNFMSEIDFGKEQYKDDSQNVWFKDVPVKDILYNIVKVYGGELDQNISINDIDKYGLFLMESRNADTYYMIYDDTDGVINIVFDGNTKCYINGSQEITIDSIPNYRVLNQLAPETFSEATQVSFISGSERLYTVIKVQYGAVCGYRPTDLTYPGDLIAQPGDNFTSIIDKIKTMLGNFEYYYDLDGKFIFQKKPDYLQSSWTGMIDNDSGIIIQPNYENAELAYHFEDGKLIKSYSRMPQLNQVKNDYTIWGQRPNETKIHLRYAIDKKPQKYTSITITEEDAKALIAAYPDIYIKDYTEYVQTSKTYIASDSCDWRELIYQMAKDYYKFYHSDDFLIKVAEANRNDGLYIDGKTGYEQYYQDIEGFWRYLYRPNDDDTIDEFFNEVYNEKGYNIKIKENPESLLFWFDFLDNEGEIAQFSVKAIGDRTKVDKEDKLKAIYYGEVPNVIYNFNNEVNPEDFTGYTIVNVPDYLKLLTAVSSKGTSLLEKLKDLIYNNAYVNEQIQLTAIPVYYLQPNTKVSIHDDNSKIVGEYIVSKINYSIAASATMSITAIQANELLL